MGQGGRDRRQRVIGAPGDRARDRIGDRIAPSRGDVGGIDAGCEIEFLDPQVRARAHAGGSEPQLPRLSLRRTDQRADGSDGCGLARDEHVGLSGERRDWDEVRKRVVGEVRQKRRAVACALVWTSNV